MDDAFLGSLADEIRNGSLEPTVPAGPLELPIQPPIQKIYSYDDYNNSGLNPGPKPRRSCYPNGQCGNCGVRGGFPAPGICPKPRPNNYVPTFRGQQMDDPKEPIAGKVLYPSVIPPENDTLVLSHASLTGSAFSIHQSLKPGDSIRITNARCHEDFADYSIQMVEQVNAKGEKTECPDGVDPPPKPKPKHKPCPKCDDPYSQTPTPSYQRPSGVGNSKVADCTCKPREGPQYDPDHEKSSLNKSAGVRLTVKHVRSAGIHPFDGNVHVSYGGYIGMEFDAVGGCDGTYSFDNGESIENLVNFTDPVIDTSSVFQINGRVRTISLLIQGNVTAPGPVSLEVTDLIFSLPPAGTLFGSGVVLESDNSIISVGTVSGTETSFQISWVATVAGATQIRIFGKFCVHNS